MRPPNRPKEAATTLNVKVDKGYKIRSRSGYCNVKSADALAGKPSENATRNAHSIARSPGDLVSPTPQVTFFFNGPDTARVDLAMDIPSDKIKFEKVKGKLKLGHQHLGLGL